MFVSFLVSVLFHSFELELEPNLILRYSLYMRIFLYPFFPRQFLISELAHVNCTVFHFGTFARSSRENRGRAYIF